MLFSQNIRGSCDYLRFKILLCVNIIERFELIYFIDKNISCAYIYFFLLRMMHKCMQLLVEYSMWLINWQDDGWFNNLHSL